uniref:Uncharacterized protein n=1 Tax=Anguilla anguilla TaxID=7936 RepID=A0A0E9RXV2_ANGAN
MRCGTEGQGTGKVARGDVGLNPSCGVIELRCSNIICINR